MEIDVGASSCGFPLLANLALISVPKNSWSGPAYSWPSTIMASRFNSVTTIGGGRCAPIRTLPTPVRHAADKNDTAKRDRRR